MKKRYTVHVKAKGLEDKEYEGTFSMKRPNLLEMGAISAGISRLNQGEPFSSTSMEAVFTAMAHINVCSEEAPEWWSEICGEGQDGVVDTRALMSVWTQITKERDTGAQFRSSQSEQSEAIEGSVVADSPQD